MPFRLPMGSGILESGRPGLLLPPETNGAALHALRIGQLGEDAPVSCWHSAWQSRIGYASRLDLDVLLLHAQRADRHGNIEIFGARGQDATLAFAARHVLVTVEEIVPTDELGTMRNSFVLPRHFVSGLSVVPGGAYPTSCLPYYTADFACLAHITTKSPPPSVSPGEQTTGRLRAAASLSHNAVRAAVAQIAVRQRVPADESAASEKPPTTDEIMVSWLARQLDNDSICSAGAVSPLAVTSYMLAKATHAPGLAIFMTSGGLLDIAVRPMLLSLGEALDTVSAVAQCGGEDSYRWYYQQGRVTCEVVTAAQIDRHARTNNIEVTSPSGRRVRLPGQGGMADVADLHQNFILYLTRQSPLTLVASVERVSAARSLFEPAARQAAGLRPGAVKLITDLGVFGYAEDRGELVLESLHPGVSMAQLRDATGFEPAVHADLGVTAVPEPDVLRVLREDIDPLGIRRLEFAPARERGELLSKCVAAEQELIGLALQLDPGS
jgi:glutaconate CoA-transferase subunit A